MTTDVISIPTYVTDASALTAYLLREPGMDVVKSIVSEPAVSKIAHAVNLCEVYYDSLRGGSVEIARQTIEKILALNVECREDMDTAFWELVGQLKVNPGKISLADCFGLALAMREGATLVTADHHEFDRIVSLNLCPILFIR